MWLYFRFSLSFRDVEEMAAERGVTVTYESVREWCLKFGGAYAKRMRSRSPRPGDFQVFVSVLICRSYDELRRQFVLVNNTRPLPKALIYELLPSVSDLPDRLSSRSAAAALTERLNFDKNSSLAGMIYQHTNPSGIIRDTAIQKVIMTSSSDGALREFVGQQDAAERSFQTISEFYDAVKATFPDDWIGHNPKTSRLVHRAGIRAMGYVMDLLWERNGARNKTAFRQGLECLVGKTAWTRGVWRFGEEEVIPWNGIQNIDGQILRLAHYLVGVVRRSGTAPEVKEKATIQ